ncbi:MAG: hypothetical protein EXS26_03680 [Opitutales bacterium]|nr:hypothetical protein [Opitutales bacterium]
MVRNLFVLSLLSLAIAGCMGPERGPSPVTDGAGSGDLVPTALSPVTVTPVLAPEPAPAPTKAPTKGKGKLPLNSSSNK